MKISETIYHSGPDFYDALLVDIAKAKHTIFLEIYIFNHDAIGLKIANALADAAARGVSVRVLIDGAGSFLMWDGELQTIMEAQGVEIRVFHPFPWHIETNSEGEPRSLLNKFIMTFLNINVRNHRKTCIIDDRIVLTGSMNISQCHIGDDKNDGWRDTAIRLEHIDIAPLLEACEHAWDRRRFYTPLTQMAVRKLPSDPVLRVNHTWRHRRVLFKSLMRQIRHCQKRIWITSAYFVPDNIVLKQLVRAAKRGVDVRILVPQHSDVMFMTWISASFYPFLMNNGVKIYEYHPKMMHAKLIIIDDWIIVGSSNFNHRSMFHDLEIDVRLQLKASKQSIVEQFKQDLALSHPMHQGRYKPKVFYKRWIGAWLVSLKHWF